MTNVETMVSSCGLSRLLVGAALGYVGASPLNNSLASWLGAGLGISVVYAWRRWITRASTCDLALVPLEESSEESSSPSESQTSL
jgi:hypothetical protein